MKAKDRLDGMTVFFSHPPFTFRTSTERYCISILDKLNVKKVINPIDYGLKDDMRALVRKSDAVIGMSVNSKLTFLVWNEMKYAEKHGKEIFTMMVESKDDIGPLIEGIPDNVKKLSLDESKIFTSEILSEHRETFFSLIIGNWGRRF
ncbi:MAG: hypothetical protein R6U17_05625 [Thermoplasmata archaeon]